MRFVGKDFLSMPAPPGYKAGVGRGAVGFSTSADPGGPGAGRGRAGPAAAAGTGAFPGRLGDHSRAARENKEAEAIYAAVESRLAPKRARRASPTAAAPAASSTPSTPSTATVPSESPLAASLRAVSADEWAQLPDATDLTHRNKRLREDERALRRNYAVPDSLILAQQSAEQRLADLRRRRQLLERLLRAEPRNPSGFLGLARLEAEAARHKRARVVIERGTLMCPQSPDVWLASIDLHPHSAEARAIVAKACRACPTSEAVWLRAAELEPTAAAKTHVVHEALLHCSHSEPLWALAAELEDDAAARQAVLRTALEFVPGSEALWLALVDTADAGDARRDALAAAAAACATSVAIWLRAAREAASDATLEQLAQDVVAGAQIPRHELLRALFGLGAEDARVIAALARALRLQPADLAEQSPQPETRALLWAAMPKSEALYLEWAKTDPQVLTRAVGEFPQSSALWREYIAAGGDVEAALEMSSGAALSSDTAVSSDTALNRGAEMSSDAEALLVEEAVVSLLRQRRRETALEVLEVRAERAPPVLLAWLADLYAADGRDAEARRVVERSLARHAGAAELYLLLARIDAQNAAAHLRQGVAAVAASDAARPRLWQELARSAPSSVAERAALSQALAECPRDGALWLQRLLLEKREGRALARVLDEALSRSAPYGLLWWEAILAAPLLQRKRKLAEAVRGSRGDAYVLLAGALMHAAAGERDKARDWFTKAQSREPRNGDIILWMAKYDLADDTLVDTAVNGVAREGHTWAPLFRAGVLRGRVRDEFDAASARLQNPFQ